MKKPVQGVKPLPAFPDPRSTQYGALIRAPDLPNLIGGDIKWSPEKKLIAVLAVRHQLISLEELLQKFNIRAEEWGVWEQRYKAYGLEALRELRVLSYPVPSEQTLQADPTIQIGNILLDGEKGEATVNGQAFNLTPTYFKILHLLAGFKDTVVSKGIIFHTLYADRNNKPNGLKIVDISIHYLRKRLKQAGATVAIETVWGRGYYLREIPPTAE